jgi:lysophospholipase L1-like esterase
MTWHTVGVRRLTGLWAAVSVAAVTLVPMTGQRALADSAGASSASSASGAASAVSPSPARVLAPVSVAVLGDSLSQGTGSNGPGSPGGSIGAPRLSASWATGDHAGLQSYADRLARTAGRPVTRVNLSANGASMREHFVDQARSVPAGIDLVLVQMGGNDLCRSEESQMTSVEDYRAQFRTGLDWLSRHRPDTLVMVSSIPDIYSLWYVRGAAHRGEQWPVMGFVLSGREGPRAPRSFTENNNKRAARLLWDTVGVVPCQTMLFRPNVPRNSGPRPDPANTAEQRRLRVRERNQAFNQVLAEECAAMLRCRFDGGELFDFVSNRGPDGELSADKSAWRFRDTDISTQDHFHPSFAGQRKLAEVTWASGFDWADTSPPQPSVSLRASPSVRRAVGDAWFSGPVSVEVSFSDEAGVRGLEYRVHDAQLQGTDPSSLAWTPVFDDRVSIKVTRAGTVSVEARAIDVNGNLSASELIPVSIDRTAPNAMIESPRDGQVLRLGQRLVARYFCSDEGSGIRTCQGDTPVGGLVEVSEVGPGSIRVSATDRVGLETTAHHRYHVRYAWSGLAAPLVAGNRHELAAGQLLPVRFGLGDAHGNPITSAGAEVNLFGPDGRAQPVRSVLSRFGVHAPVWSPRHGEFVLLVDTRSMATGVWEVVVRPDDGSEHRTNLEVTADAG